MPGLRDDVDPDGLLEYSVVFTDRGLNHMSAAFVDVMQSSMSILRETYRSDGVAIVPGGGTTAMEAVARQLGTGKRCLVLRNGFFSYRWSQIIEMGSITDQLTVLKASSDGSPAAPFSPVRVDEVVAAIASERPEVVFAPHVETSSGILLGDDYLRAVGEATREVGGIFVLDCIASGALWVDMEATSVDVLISAPQKGWSGRPGMGFVMLNNRARSAVSNTTSTTFSADLKKWLSIADGYVDGKTAYHSTMPTDTMRHNVAVMAETLDVGLEHLRERQRALGFGVREMLADRGFASVAAPEFASPSVVVSYTERFELSSAAAFKRVGIQAAAGVPLFCDEPEGFQSFRIGLFGLDKWADVDGCIARLADGLDRL